MKKILFFISVLTTLAFTSTFVGSTTVIITPSSKLLINGKTNVNSFKCLYNVLKLNKPIPVFFKEHQDKIIFEKTTLVLENANFDCGGTGINNDFQELLKTETYPQIFIKLKEISKDPNNKTMVQTLLDLEIAGVTKSYTIPVQLVGDDIMSIKGILSLNIRDFNLDPPKKALGLIVVKDTIEIDFQLMVKEY
jgi:YceI-like domain